MRHFRIWVLLPFFLMESLFLVCRAQGSYPKEVEENISKVEKGLTGWVKTPDGDWTIQERMDFYRIPGVTIGVIRNYKLEWAKGYGYADTSDKRPVTTQTLFQAASISKSLNAVGALKLVDRKKIDLSKDINTYLRSWVFPYDTSKTHNVPITVSHLLSHTGGLSVHGFPGYKWSDSLPSDNDILDGRRPANTAAVRSEFEPGTRVKYSGGGTTISKKIIMDVSGMPYDKYMTEEVLRPLGMVSSFYTQPPPPGSFPHLATAYNRNGKPLKGKFHLYPEQAADGLWTNPTDLAKYIIEIQLSYEGRSNKVLSKEITQTMLTPIMENAALGVFIETRGDKKYFGHSGGNEGFRCQYFGSIENGNGVIVMVNSDNGGIIAEIINSVGNVYNWTNFSTQVSKAPIPIHVDTLARYEGTYQLEKILLKVVRKENTLYLIQDESPPAKMYFTSPADFFLKEVRADASFQKNPQGSVEAILIKQNGREFRAIRLQ